MPILLLLLLLAVLLWMGLSRRGSTLTRQCRWRPDRRTGPQDWRCAASGARCVTDRRGGPNDCLREAGTDSAAKGR